MATKKKTSRKASAKKASRKKASAKKASAKVERVSINDTRKIKAYAGQEHHFYNGFPRGEAYAILRDAPKGTMVVSEFVKKVTSLPKVKTEKQALGIVQKLIGKPGDTGDKGAVCRFV